MVSGMQRRSLVVKTVRRRYVETDDGGKALGRGYGSWSEGVYFLRLASDRLVGGENFK